MANEYSIEWTGDQSFKISFNDLFTYCLITSLYGDNFNGVYGPLNFAKISGLNIEAQQLAGLVFTSNNGGYGVFSCTGINTAAPSYIEEVFILFGERAAINTRAQDIVKGYASTASTSGANNAIQSATWSAIVTRQQSTPLSTPTGLYADNIKSDSATTHWTGDANASNYKVQYKAAGDTVWTETYTD